MPGQAQPSQVTLPPKGRGCLCDEVRGGCVTGGGQVHTKLPNLAPTTAPPAPKNALKGQRTALPSLASLRSISWAC